MTTRNEALAAYAQIDEADPALAKYEPTWLDSMTEDVILEGSMLDGVVQGRENVRHVIGAIRAGYAREAHTYVDESGGRLVEEYVAVLHGRPIACILLISRDGVGRVTRIAAGYRPLSALNVLANILREKLAGLPYAEQFGQAK